EEAVAAAAEREPADAGPAFGGLVIELVLGERPGEAALLLGQLPGLAAPRHHALVGLAGFRLVRAGRVEQRPQVRVLVALAAEVHDHAYAVRPAGPERLDDHVLGHVGRELEREVRRRLEALERELGGAAGHGDGAGLGLRRGRVRVL